MKSSLIDVVLGFLMALAGALAVVDVTDDRDAFGVGLIGFLYLEMFIGALKGRSR